MSDTVLCLNTGSSNIKFERFEVLSRDELQLAFRGQLEGIGFQRVACYVIPTNEELMIGRHALALVRQPAASSFNAEPAPSARGRMIRVSELGATPAQLGASSHD